MERTSCSLIYYLRKTRIDKEGKAPIYACLFANGKRIEVYTRIRVGARHSAKLLKKVGRV